jgi:hypothetical protein
MSGEGAASRTTLGRRFTRPGARLVLPGKDTEELQIGVGHVYESQVKIKEHTDATEGGSYVMAGVTTREAVTLPAAALRRP